MTLTLNQAHERSQTERLQQIFDDDGTAAFDRAAVGLLFMAAALISTVEGNGRLGDLIGQINNLHPIMWKG